MESFDSSAAYARCVCESDDARVIARYATGCKECGRACGYEGIECEMDLESKILALLHLVSHHSANGKEAARKVAQSTAVAVFVVCRTTCPQVKSNIQVATCVSVFESETIVLV